MVYDFRLLFYLIAGIIYLLGMILYSAGWGAERVQRICGIEADAFYLANCTLGKTFFILLTIQEGLFTSQILRKASTERILAPSPRIVFAHLFLTGRFAYSRKARILN
jgi:hypothetical protein